MDLAIGNGSLLAVTADGTLVESGGRESRRPADATHVATSECLVCVITRAGAADCRDDKGQPLALPGPLTAFAPSCGGGCGLRPDGSVACVGAAGAPPPAPPIAGARVADIAATPSRVCAVTADGRLTCSGRPWPGPWWGMRILTDAKP